jgi:hypothetical protein
LRSSRSADPIFNSIQKQNGAAAARSRFVAFASGLRDNLVTSEAREFG